MNFPNLMQKHCLFEYIYFLNKDSKFENTEVKTYRKEIGKLMGIRDREYFKSLTQKNDSEFIVCGVPNTGNDYAQYYSKYVEIPFKNYILKNSEVSRTFILSNDEERNKYANVKYLFDKNIKNKNVIIIDDSIVRGITLKNLIKNLKDFGVLKIYIIVASPPINNTCNYGIDIPTKEELIINKIAEKDLAIRGAGEILGTRQTGDIGFKIADLSTDASLLPLAKQNAEEIIDNNPDLGQKIVNNWLPRGNEFSLA